MIKLEHEVVIERPLEEVFGYVSDPSRVPEWQSGVLEVRKDGDEPMRAGLRWREVRTFMGRRVEGTLEATAYEPNTEFALRVVSGPIPLRVRQRFESTDGGTRISIVAEGEPGGVFKFGERLVRRAAERQLKGDFAKLKDVLEARRP